MGEVISLDALRQARAKEAALASQRTPAFHFIYKVTCQITGKFYIGKHSTSDLNDGYLGSGLQLRRSLLKHGRKNHAREILEFLPSFETLTTREREIVNEEFLQNPNVMNLRVGGDNGWRHTSETREKMRMAASIRKVSDETRKKLSEAQRKTFENGRTYSPEHIEKIRQSNARRSGEKRTTTTRKQMSASARAAWIKRKEKWAA